MTTQKLNFTKQSIEAIAAPNTGRTLVYDEGGKQSVKGLAIQVTAAGTRTFQVYKWAAGKPLRVTLGRYPDLTIEQARKAAAQALGNIATGTNPNTEKRIERAKAVTLSELLTQYTKTRTLKATTVDDIHKAFHQVIPDWLTKPITKITPSMVQKRHRDHATRSPARANLAMRYLRALFSFAQAAYKDDDEKPIIAINPVKSLSELKAWHRVERRRTCIAPDELGPWVNAVLNLANDAHRDYLLFVLMTGCRRNEGMGLTWEDVNLKANTVIFRDTKNHNDHTLPLPDYLVSMLAQRHQARAARLPEKQSIFVFVDSSGRKISNLRTTQAAVTQASGVNFCLHDLRRTFATLAESLDIPGYALKRLLNHAAAGDVTSGYLVITPERLREPMQKVCDYVLKSAGLKPSAAIIPLHRKSPTQEAAG